MLSEIFLGHHKEKKMIFSCTYIFVIFKKVLLLNFFCYVILMCNFGKYVHLYSVTNESIFSTNLNRPLSFFSFNEFNISLCEKIVYHNQE